MVLFLFGGNDAKFLQMLGTFITFYGTFQLQNGMASLFFLIPPGGPATSEVGK